MHDTPKDTARDHDALFDSLGNKHTVTEVVSYSLHVDHSYNIL